MFRLCVNQSWLFSLLLLSLASSGCASIAFPIEGRSASALPTHLRAEPKRDLIPIDVSRLAQPRPAKYRLDEGDVIGLYVETVLPFRSATEPPVAPSVTFPSDSNLRPAIGTPLAVEEGGALTLPGFGIVNVKGLSFGEAAEEIRDAYIEAEVLDEDAAMPSITLIAPRRVNVLVIREDTGGAGAAGGVVGLMNDRQAMGGPVTLDAYKNDVLNALMATGGLPGLRAKNEIRIYRRPLEGQVHQVEFEDPSIAGMLETPGYATDHGFEVDSDEWVDGPERIIPLRIRRGEVLQLAPQDVILEEGDVVYIANRDTEVFYTSGLLPPGEFLMPRDYDIDIFEAMSIAGYSYGTSGSTAGGLMGGATVPPTQLFIFRDVGESCETTIEVDLAKAIRCPEERLLVRPGDKLLLRHTCKQETANFGLFTFFTVAVQQLFRN